MTKPLSRRTFFRLGGAGCVGLLTAPASALLTLLTAGTAEAYNHVHAHKRINELSLKAFVRRVKNDPYGTYKQRYDRYDFKTEGPKVKGFTVKAPGAVEVEQHLVELSFADWLREGGYTADEPEVLSSLRHFYDPLAMNRDSRTGQRATYLTDFIDPWIKEAAARFYGLREAKMDAREWAITGPARSGFDENKYSWKKGLWYMQRAFKEENPEQTQKLFAAAWRSLGETMHLMADMTVPAHVRNDAHPGNPIFPDHNLTASGMKIDPYEWYIVDNNPELGDVIEASSKHPLDGNVASTLESTSDIWKLFHAVASFTNKNFFSADTVSGKHPDTGKMVKPGNEMASYPSPRLENCTLDPLGYFEMNGRPVAHMDWADNTWWNSANSMRQQLWNMIGWRKAMSSYQDVCAEQAKTLIPMAIAATGKLIEWFLPRVEVEIYDFTMVNRQIKGVVVHDPGDTCYGDPDMVESTEPMKFNKGPRDWSRLTINGVPYSEPTGAYTLKIEDGRIYCHLAKAITLKGPGQNKFDLMLYMGGFWVHSTQVMPQALSVPYMRVDAFAGETFSMHAGTNGVTMPKQPEYVVSFGDDSKAQVGASPGGSHVYSTEGQYLATVMLYDKKTGKLVAGGYSMVTVNPSGLTDKEKASIRQQQKMMNSQFDQMPSGPVEMPAPESVPSTTVSVDEIVESELQKLRDSGVSEAEIAKIRKQMEMMYKQMDPDAVRP